MMIFSVKRLFQKNNYLPHFIPVLILALASLMPIWQSFGKLSIGGDVIIPLIPKFSYHNTFEWVEYTNGAYASNDYFIWVTLFFLLVKTFSSIYTAAFIFQFLIFFLSSLGIYSLFNLFNSRSHWWGLLPAIAFLYSPYQYDHMHYFYGTAAVIWLFYILFRFIKTKQLSLLQIFFISLLLGCIGNLPNPKYHFLVVITFFIVIMLSLFIRILDLHTIKKNIFYIFLIILGSLYLSLPFVQFGRNFAYDTGIKVNTVNKEAGRNNQTMDYGSATLNKMLTLWHTPGLNKFDTEIMMSTIFTISYYSLAIIVFAIFPLVLNSLSLQQKKVNFLFYFLAALFIFLAKSSNQPFGDYYMWLLTNIRVLAFLRTTAGIVIFAAIFYSLLIGITVQSVVYNYKKYRLPLLIVTVFGIAVAGFHSWSGEHFRNFSPVNAYIDTRQHGLTVPEDYFKAASFLATRSLITKIDIIPGASGYQNNYWGYFGPIIYPWIFKQPSITIDKNSRTSTFPSHASTRYIVYDKSLIQNKKDKELTENALNRITRIYSSSTIDIYQRQDDDYYPVLYSYSEDGPNTQFISSEYTHVNPTKFIVRLHRVPNKFNLIFTANYHPLWQLYTNHLSNPQNLFQLWSSKKNLYTVSASNRSDQASVEEINELLARGSISSLSNAAENSVQFISKPFHSSIQNNNIPSGVMLDTWFMPKTPFISHIKENGFANKWSLNADEICSTKNLCYKNSDGTYDIELTGEFKPQQTVYFSYIISAISLSAMVCLYFIKNRKTR